MKNKSDFFLNNFFEFENRGCICQKETIHSAPDEPPYHILKLCSVPQNPLYFSYSAQKGLNQSGNAGGIMSENILGQLLALPSDDLDSVIRFFEKYGFLLPISTEVYESIDEYSLFTIINRIKATIKLMGTIAGKRDYKNMLILTTYLLYSAPVTIKLSTGEYSTCFHPYQQILGQYSNMLEPGTSQEIYETGFFSVEDTITGGYNKVSSDDILGMQSGDGIFNLPGSREPHYSNLFALYTNYASDDVNLRTIIDFYYHYQTEVGIFKDVSINSLSYHAAPKRENFSDAMKESLLKIAQLVISKEINYHLKGISPQYEMSTLSPSWKLNSFIEALYFSVFYMKPGVELYKECENPTCKRDKYFLIKATATNKKYCCQACSNAAAQRRSRQNKLSK